MVFDESPKLFFDAAWRDNRILPLLDSGLRRNDE
jgi:hypothetical protein